MDKIQVKSEQRSYTVYFGTNLRFDVSDYLPKTYTAILVVTDTQVGQYYLQDVLQGLRHETVFHIAITPGEQMKDINSFYQLHTAAHNAGLDRNSAIIALGGGMVGDVAGFTAATYMRGIDFIQMPTTILAHDSSIGGKVAINHDHAKNMIGSFHAPAAVIYDIDMLKSLSLQEIRSGYAELIKEAFILSPDFLNDLLNVDLQDLDRDTMTHHLVTGMSIKQSIVEIDEHETGIRAFLNLGHTLGHAIESEAGYGTYTHGEAVAIGLAFALYVSEASGSGALSLDRYFKWLHSNDYPLILPHTHPERYVQVMRTDKKTTDSVISMVLLKAVGEPFSKSISDETLLTHLQAFFTKLKTLSGDGSV